MPESWLFIFIYFENLINIMLFKVIMAIKEVIKTIEYYRQTAVSSPVYVELIKDLRSKLHFYETFDYKCIYIYMHT